MATYRTMYRYHFKLGNKIVRTGITNDIDRCAYAHKREDGWDKGHIKQVGPRTTLEDARAWEREQAKRGKPVRSDLVVNALEVN